MKVCFLLVDDELDEEFGVDGVADEDCALLLF
jgi:hypothetical protein